MDEIEMFHTNADLLVDFYYHLVGVSPFHWLLEPYPQHLQKAENITAHLDIHVHKPIFPEMVNLRDLEELPEAMPFALKELAVNTVLPFRGHLTTTIIDWAKTVAVPFTDEPTYASGYALMNALTFTKYLKHQRHFFEWTSNKDQIAQGFLGTYKKAKFLVSKDIEPGVVLVFPNPDQVAKVLLGFQVYNTEDQLRAQSLIRIEPVESPQVEIYPVDLKEYDVH